MILNGRTLIEILPLVELYTVFDEHHRLETFVHKGRECVTCGREGVLLLVTVEKNGKRHVDLYTEDFVLMTVDHELPKAKGGLDILSNKQPMCEPCNHAKGSQLISNEQHALNRLRNGRPQLRTGVEVIRSLVHNEGIFNKTLAF